MMGSKLTTHEALSGAFGSISLAAWIFVLVTPLNPLKSLIKTDSLQVPQLLENFQTGSADGISLAFLAVWFIGDLANFFGAIWAGLVPTVIALAVYFCIADTVLIVQCLYYKNVNRRKRIPIQTEVEDPTQPLLTQTSNAGSQPVSSQLPNPYISRLRSLFLQYFKGATRSWLRNTVGVAAVCATGTLGWAIAWKVGAWEETLDDSPAGDNIGASILGYTSAICYLRLVAFLGDQDGLLTLFVQRKNTANHEKLSGEVL